MRPTNKQYLVYKATSPSGKIYIGITAEDLSTRIHKHFYQAKRVKTKFASALNKYGQLIKWEILKSNISKNLSIRYESYFIRKLNTFKAGYNSTKGGEGAFGYKWDKAVHSVYHQQRVEKFYKNDDFKSKQSTILKEFYKKNPKRCKENGNLLNKWRADNKDIHEPKRLAGIKSESARLKNSIARGGKEFNVYDFVKKEYVGTWKIQKDCATVLGLSNGKIANCLRGSRNFHRTFIFKYTDDPTVAGTQFNESWLYNIKRSPNAR